jgi:hypothetical protein
MNSNSLFTILRAANSQQAKTGDKKKFDHVDLPFSRPWEMACFFLAGVLCFLTFIALLTMMI